MSVRRPRPTLLIAMIGVSACTASDPIAAYSPYATMACGGLYLALADAPSASAADRSYYMALADGLIAAASNADPGARPALRAEMEHWRNEWQEEAQSDWAQTAAGQAEAEMLQAECSDLISSLPETRNIRRGG